MGVNALISTKSLVCLAVALLLFVTQAVTHLSPGVVALTAAMILFLVTRMEIKHILLEIEWSTLLFFLKMVDHLITEMGEGETRSG